MQPAQHWGTPSLSEASEWVLAGALARAYHFPSHLEHRNLITSTIACPLISSYSPLEFLLKLVFDCLLCNITCSFHFPSLFPTVLEAGSVSDWLSFVCSLAYLLTTLNVSQYRKWSLLWISPISLVCSVLNVCHMFHNFLYVCGCYKYILRIS